MLSWGRSVAWLDSSSSHRPTEIEGQRASDLRFGDKLLQALFAVLGVFSLQPRGFTNQEIRTLLAQPLGLDPANYTMGQMT